MPLQTYLQKEHKFWIGNDDYRKSFQAEICLILLPGKNLDFLM